VTKSTLNGLLSICSEYPCPWEAVEARSGVLIKDANGTTVLFAPFTGLTTRARRRKAAALVIQAVNHVHAVSGYSPIRG